MIFRNDDDDENDDDGSGEAKGSESHIENYSISVSTLLANSKMNHDAKEPPQSG